MPLLVAQDIVEFFREVVGLFLEFGAHHFFDGFHGQGLTIENDHTDFNISIRKLAIHLDRSNHLT